MIIAKAIRGDACNNSSKKLLRFLMVETMNLSRLKMSNPQINSEENSREIIVENRIKGISGGNGRHNGGKENSGANAGIFSAFARGTFVKNGRICAGAENEKTL